MNESFDVVVVGAGIVGLATARALLQHRNDLRIAVLDKEMSIAGHQTGRNSGVIHAGVYYPPGSDKAMLCTTGRRQLINFCREFDVPYALCGKLVLATDDTERTRLMELHRRCQANGIDVDVVGPQRIAELEPHAVGVAALHVRDTGIVDFPAMCAVLASQITGFRGQLLLGTAVLAGREIDGRLLIETTSGEIRSRALVNCAGLQADRVARAIGGPSAANGLMIVPFRGEYFEVQPTKRHLVKALIYPVPDPQFPFLGVHLTRSIHGGIHVGPNAVLALAREGYSWRRIVPSDVRETLGFPGMRRLAKQHWRYGASEVARSLSRRRFAASLARLVPEVTAADLIPAASGVRAQAIDAQGKLVQDFAFGSSNGGRALHVLNAPSPAATASLAIGERIAAEMLLRIQN